MSFGHDTNQTNNIVSALKHAIKKNTIQPFKVSDIPDGTFISRLNHSFFLQWLLFFKKPSVRKELLGYTSISIICY